MGIKMPKFTLSKKSISKLSGVDPRLIACVVLALFKYSEVDFTVNEGIRTLEQQRENVKKGVSKTLKSYHLDGRAVDLLPLPIDWNNIEAFKKVAKAMFLAADDLGITILNGGTSWGWDWPHFQLEK